MIALKDIIRHIEEFAPLQLQESYDNSGLLVGDPEMEINGVLLCVDCTEEVFEEALEKGANLIVSHHPLIFKGLKAITGKNQQERILIEAIKNDVAIYAVHTNIDAVIHGVSGKMADLLTLNNQKILSPFKGNLKKIVTFVPESHIENVREHVFSAGAGSIGKYSNCGFSSSGFGTFQAQEGAEPFVGEIGQLHTEAELRFETVFPAYLQNKVVKALKESHPYEEVAYDIYTLDNGDSRFGMGIVGDLEFPMDELTFLNHIKKTFHASMLRYTALLDKPVRRIAVCGGSGSTLLDKAIAQKADVFITGDFKYHQFFEAEGKILIADLGHYETEQYTKDIFYDLLVKKIPNFAVYLSEINSNPINYL